MINLTTCKLDYDEDGLKNVCEKYGFSLAVLHGSFAKGTSTPKSDVDVGFLGDGAVIHKNYFDILKDLAAVFGDKLDPVFINGAEAMITRNVALNGVPLYERAKGLFNSFKVTAMARYMDTKKFRILEKQYIKSAVKKETR
ncbi:MAG: nucleotidyltransferase domain-containing protein [Candidatus Omnitrophica bacterium]|nr:nucleotidyltransferase domain-containing protein [Candidatus Omnitrophota bacterium]